MICGKHAVELHWHHQGSTGESKRCL